MKILHLGINLVPSRGGIYQSVISFTRAFEHLNYTVEVISFGDAGGSSAFRCPSRFIETVGVPGLKQYYIWPGFYAGRFSELIGCPDLVFIHGLFYQAAIRAARYCTRHKIPYIIVSHGSLDPYVFTYRRMRKQLWTTLYRRPLFTDSAAVLFSTAEEARKAAKWTSGSKVEIIPWPVERVPDYDKSRARAVILAKYNLSPQTRVALYCGRLHPVKRPLETIRAFKAAATKDWALLAVGPTADPLPRDVVEAACQEPGPRCIYCGPAYGQELLDHFRAADLFILWSHKENFSHVTAEALACGVPVFLSKGVDLWRDLAPAGCAFLAPDDRREEGAMRSALGRVLTMSQESLAAAGQRGCDWARKELSEEVFAHRINRLCVATVTKNDRGLRASTPSFQLFLP